MRTEEKKNGRGKTHPFVTDVKKIRRRARTHIEEGAVTEVYRAHRETVVRLLNEALASAIVCVLRYPRHYFMATGIHAHAVAREFSSRRWGTTSGSPSLLWTRAANRSSTRTVLVERKASSASHERAARDHGAGLPPVSDGWTKVQ